MSLSSAVTAAGSNAASNRHTNRNIGISPPFGHRMLAQLRRLSALRIAERDAAAL
jgi:hypothetical protein